MSDNGDVCVICLETIEVGIDVESCPYVPHRYCGKCLFGLLVREFGNDPIECPQCRTPISKLRFRSMGPSNRTGEAFLISEVLHLFETLRNPQLRYTDRYINQIEILKRMRQLLEEDAFIREKISTKISDLEGHIDRVFLREQNKEKQEAREEAWRQEEAAIQEASARQEAAARQEAKKILKKRLKLVVGVSALVGLVGYLFARKK